MLQALGPRLQHLAIGYDINHQERTHQCTPQDSLAPSILKHCPQLAELTLEHDLWPGDTVTAQVAATTAATCVSAVIVAPSLECQRWVCTAAHYSCLISACVQGMASDSLTRCTQLHLICPSAAEVRVPLATLRAGWCTVSRVVYLCMRASTHSPALPMPCCDCSPSSECRLRCWRMFRGCPTCTYWRAQTTGMCASSTTQPSRWS